MQISRSLASATNADGLERMFNWASSATPLRAGQISTKSARRGREGF